MIAVVVPLHYNLFLFLFIGCAKMHQNCIFTHSMQNSFCKNEHESGPGGPRDAGPDGESAAV